MVKLEDLVGLERVFFFGGGGDRFFLFGGIGMFFFLVGFVLIGWLVLFILFFFFVEWNFRGDFGELLVG